MIEIHVVSVDGKHKKIIPVSLDFLPKRPIKTRRICFKTNFLSNKTMNLEISDAGFGDMYPAMDVSRSIEVSLWD